MERGGVGCPDRASPESVLMIAFLLFGCPFLLMGVVFYLCSDKHPWGV